MSDSTLLVLGCLGTILIAALGLAYIFTSIGREKSECPECGKQTVTKNAFVVDQSTGEKVQGERDFGFSLVSATGEVVIGAGVLLYMLSIVIPALGNESCYFEGIGLVCAGYSINLPIAFIAVLGGLGAILNGGVRFRRAFATRGKQLTCEFECPSCKHTWAEEVPVPA